MVDTKTLHDLLNYSTWQFGVGICKKKNPPITRACFEIRDKSVEVFLIK